MWPPARHVATTEAFRRALDPEEVRMDPQVALLLWVVIGAVVGALFGGGRRDGEQGESWGLCSCHSFGCGIWCCVLEASATQYQHFLC